MLSIQGERVVSRTEGSARKAFHDLARSFWSRVGAAAVGVARLVTSSITLLSSLMRASVPFAPYIAAALAACAVVLSVWEILADQKSPFEWQIGAWVMCGLLVVVLSTSIVLGGRWATRAASSEEEGTNRPGKPVYLAIAAVALLGSMLVYGEFDALLASSHQDGEGVFTANFPIIPRGPLPPAYACTAVGTWSRYARPELTRATLRSGGSRDVVAQCETLAPSALTGSGEDTAPVAPPTTVIKPFVYDAAPVAVLAWTMLVDSAVLIPAYAALLLLLIIWARWTVYQHAQQIRTTADRPPAGLAPPPGGPAVDAGDAELSRVVRTNREIGTYAAIAVVIAAAADWAENVMTLLLVTSTWADAGQPLVCHWSFSSACGPLGGLVQPVAGAWLLWGFAVLKWVGLGLAGLYLIGVALLLIQHAAARPGRDNLRWAELPGLVSSLAAVGVPVLVVLPFGLLLVNDQMPEIIWRWREAWYVGALGCGLALILAFGVTRLSAGLLDNAASIAKHQHRPSALIPAFVATVLFVAGGLWLWFRGPAQNPKLLLVPAGIAAAIFLLGWPLRDETVDAPAVTPPGLGRRQLPGVLGAAVVCLLGLGLIGATANILLYQALRFGGLDPRGRGPDLFFVGLVVVGVILVCVGVVAGYRIVPDPDRFKKRIDCADCRPPRVEKWTAVLAVGIVGWALTVQVLSMNDLVQTITPWLGVVGVVSVALGLFCAVGSAIVVLVDALVPTPRALRALKLARVPVLPALAVWWALAAFLPPQEPLHDVRFQPASVASEPRVGEQLASAFQAWRFRNCLVVADPASAGDPRNKPVVPLVLVATTGGGIRAAAWTAYVMDRVFGYDRPTERCTGQSADRLEAVPRGSRLFAASGVSGGSVGLATFAARWKERGQQDIEELCLRSPESCGQLKDTTEPADCGPVLHSDASDGWIRKRLGGCDLLAPTLGWMLLAETPWSFLRNGLTTDRAAVLDASWERVWRLPQTPGLFELRRSQQDWQAMLRESQERGRTTNNGQLSPADVAMLYAKLDAEELGPLLLLNGTSVESGCRFNGSVLETNARDWQDPAARCLSPVGLEVPRSGIFGATVDLVDFLCRDQDIKLSTIAMLSARFPFASPSGHLKQCGDSPGAVSRPETYVVDGGYLEGTAALTLENLSAALVPMIDQHNRDRLSRAYVVPVVIQIDNGYAEAVGPGLAPAPPQFVTPLTTAVATRDGIQALVRQSLQDNENASAASDRWFVQRPLNSLGEVETPACRQAV
jgi:hypothetical protein